MAPTRQTHITIRGAHAHNLKHLDLAIPHERLTVISGVSGSGKSSLALDTLFREGQRRYLETFSTYARQFFGKLGRAAVTEIQGLPPALAVHQTAAVRGPRSTVGTLSGIYDLLRLLFARVGETMCADCGAPIPPAEAVGPEEVSGPGCGACGATFPKRESRLFSFNGSAGACPDCQGLGLEECVDPELLVADAEKTLRQGALVPTTPKAYIVYSQVTMDVLDQICRAHGFDVDTPWRELRDDQRHVIFFGSKKLKVPFGKHPLESRLKWSGITAKPREEGYYKGIITVMEETLGRNRNPNILRFVRSRPCSACDGTRLNRYARSVYLDGHDIARWSALPARELADRLCRPFWPAKTKAIAEPLAAAMVSRLAVMDELGLSYLSLARGCDSLSGGEVRRLRLATRVIGGLEGLLYVLDEPAMGLHPCEQENLLKVLRRLVDSGNTVVAVGHALGTQRAADWLIDIGPGAGRHGGRLVYQGHPADLAANHEGATATWLHGGPVDEVTAERHPRPGSGELRVLGASAHNLDHLDVTFRLTALNVVTGISGAGKSSLVDGTVAARLLRDLHGATRIPGTHRALEGADPIAKVVHLDQNPIGRTPRSNAATYTGLSDAMRALFAALPAAQEAGLGKSAFSMNVKGGRCEACSGSGLETIGMHGFENVDVPCATCGGDRFGEAVLAIRYEGCHVADLLAKTVDEAAAFFEDIATRPDTAPDSKAIVKHRRAIQRYLEALQWVGLGYLHLGQPATTLSGGEAQRIKLASALGRPDSAHTLYILDEPTTGLHAADTAKLLRALEGLVDAGNTVIAVEHHPEVMARADWIVDLGPGSGTEGGRIVAHGTPDQVAACEASLTGLVLRQRKAGILPPFSHPRPSLEADAGPRALELRGVATHNLQDIDLDLPPHALIAITGPSGSGKSSLAFDTIHAEGHRRFCENLSAQARRFIHMGERPKFDRIEGLSATIAVSQRVPAANPRATVGTMTEINDLWRLLMSRAGQEPGEASPLAGRLPASAFSFNHQAGACPDCDGLGHLLRCDPDKLITHADRPLTDGAMAGTKTGRFYGDPRGQFCAIWTTAATAHGFDPNRPWCDLPEAARTLAMYGSGQREYETTWHFQRDTRDESHQWTTAWKGFAHLVDEEYARKREDHRGGALLPLLSARSCPGCHGGRLNARSGAVRFAGATLPEWCDLSVGEAFSRLQGLIEDPTTSGLDATQGAVAETLVPNLIDRYRTLNELSLGYMTISRPVADLSGGEAQRVRLAAALGADMRGITYVLDEPTTGLHPRDVQRLIAHLRRLRDRGNRVVVVEHDAALIAASDYEVALGPGAGAEGGKLIYAGPPRGEPNLPPLGNSEDPRTLDRETGWIDIEGAHANNLRHLNLRIPKGRLTAVSGVSGSGKSSLALGVLAASAAAGRAVNCTAFEGALDLEAPIQLAVGGSMRTPTSTPATFLGILDPIRTLLAKTDAAKAAGLTKQRFSFNAPAKSGKSGPCPACKGMGRIRTSLDLLPDVWSPCEQCGGARFTADVLACRYRGHHIADILAMDAATAHEVFADQPKVRAGLEAMIQVGLPYLGLGRPGNTLSGGEAQRLRLAAALSGADGAKPRLYLLDEPTRGLQAKDVHKLKDALDRLLEAGHTVVVVEHNLDMIRHADWVIDLGPEAGAEGGGLLYSGLPADLTKVTTSWTGRALAGTLSASAQ